MSSTHFNLKVALSGIEDPVEQIEKLDYLNKILTIKVRNKEIKYKEAEKIRKEVHEKTKNLQAALAQQGINNIKQQGKETIQEIRSYDRLLKKQIKDLIKIIYSLQEIIEHEDLELLFDLNLPLKTVTEFISTIKKTLVKIPDEELKKELQQLFEKLLEEHNTIIDKTTNLIAEDISFFKKFGLSFQRVQLKMMQDTTVAQHMKKRNREKKHIQSRAENIQKTIEKQEKELKKIFSRKTFSVEEKQGALTLISFLKNKYAELLDYCLTRIEASTHTITESVSLQKEHREDLSKLKEEAKDFYTTFKQTQQQIARNFEETQHNKELAQKRVTEFKEYQQKILKEIRAFEKKTQLKLEEVEKKDIKALKIEKKELKKIERKIVRKKIQFNTFVKKAIVTVAIIATTTATAVAPAPSQEIQQQRIEQIQESKELKKLEAKKASIITKLPTILSDSTTRIAGCAAWLNYNNQKMYGDSSRVKLGITGDAWFLFQNIKSKQGTILYNEFNSIQKKYASEIDSLSQKAKASYIQLITKHGSNASGQRKARKKLNHQYAKEIREFFPSQSGVDTSKLQVGDIVGIYLKTSSYQAKAFIDNPKITFNTHVGMITSIENGEILVSHNMNGKIKHEKIEKLLSTKRSSRMIVWAVRPNNSNYKQILLAFSKKGK